MAFHSHFEFMQFGSSLGSDLGVGATDGPDEINMGVSHFRSLKAVRAH